MPTYSQLQAESWWGREITTSEIDWLGDELCRRTGRPRNAFGVKGDNNHLRGAHRSQEWILKSRYCTSRTYTVQSGLTAVQQQHLAGIDFTPGTVNQMVAQCKRLYAAMRAGRLEEVREFYGNVDGNKIVDGWDNVRNRTASSDSSHLWHWHLTLDRRHCTNQALMGRILGIALGDPTEDDVSAQDVIEGMYEPTPWQSTGVGRWAQEEDMGAKISSRALLEYSLSDNKALLAQQAVIAANLAELRGKDWVNEDAIVDGVLAGLGGRDLDDVAAALKAAFGDQAAELGAKLTAS